MKFSVEATDLRRDRDGNDKPGGTGVVGSWKEEIVVKVAIPELNIDTEFSVMSNQNNLEQLIEESVIQALKMATSPEDWQYKENQ